ncbi:MAG: type II toxin-antitoxin system HicB family antitoxin [Rhodospirillales bacterium]|nr:type II toxin-antitoxin system HicB family antitoxin [Rhodospirillales bacterium]
MFEYKGYVGTVDAAEGVFAGRVIGLRDVITFEGGTYAEVERAFRESVDDYLAFCAERGEPPDKSFSGNMMIRTEPELHRKAVNRAAAEGVSLNEWVSRQIKAA